ncbi:MAG: RagB/SusD family nutrient uptake outer membrane protein, partial [Muribaculaceae bacterium]
STDESWPCYGSMMNRLGGTASTITVTPTSDLNNEFQNDPRQMYTITGRSINRYYQQEEPSPEIGWFNYGNGLIFVKYYVFRSEGSAKGRNYRVMRLPEVMLLFAEALNETGDSRKAADYVNKIRQRARKLMDPSNPNSQYISIPDANFKDVAYAPYDIIRNAILKEKRIEMAGEFDRWFELARLGILAERMSAISKTAPIEQPSGKIRVKGRYFKKGVNELFPIPQDEILISNGVIEQNFGY